MHFSLRSKMSIALSLLLLIAIVGAFMLSGIFFHGKSTHATGMPAYGTTAGTLAAVGTVDPMQFSKGPTTPTTVKHISRSVRPIHPVATPAGPVQAASTSLDTTRTGALLQNFNGVSSHDSAVTNFGLEFEPPDQGLCVGNGFVVEPVNSAFTIYRTNGSVVAGPFNVNKLFDEGFAQFTSDPRCYFDKATHTWFAIILFINPAGTKARTDLAVNASGDPTTPWTVYHINANDDGDNGMPKHAGCPCFGDQPLLGIDASNLYISTNEFSILGSAFNGAQIYAVSKSQLVALSTSVNFVHFDNLNIGGAIATSVQPAITNGSSGAEYFLNSLDPNGLGDNRLGVWALTNQGAVSQGGVPTLSNVVITSEAYAIPPAAIQQGASSLLDTGDDRMQQVEFINGNLWGALTTTVNIPGDTSTRSGAAWFEVRPDLKAGMIAGATIQKQGYVASLGNYLFYPAIQVNQNGVASMVMTLSGPSIFPSAVYTVLRPEQSAFGAVKIAASGTGPYSTSSTRWGDYSAAVFDPASGNLWMAIEYIPPLASQTPDGFNNWGTRVLEVSA